jgi:hypothetical protein
MAGTLKPKPVPTDNLRLLLTIAEAAAVCGVSYDTAVGLANSEWPVVVVGTAHKLVPVAGLERWISERMAAQQQPAPVIFPRNKRHA